MPIATPLLLGLLLLAPPTPDECTESALRTRFNQSTSDAEVRAVRDLTRACLRRGKAAYLHFVAAQASDALRDNEAAWRALDEYDRLARADDPDRKHVADLKKSLAPRKPRPPKPTPPPPIVDPASTEPEPTKPPDTIPTAPQIADPPPTPPVTALTPRIEGPDEGTTDPPQPPPPDPPADTRPAFRRGWRGLGIATGSLGAVGLGLGLAGALDGRRAFSRNDTALRTAGLTGDFAYAQCTTPSPDCQSADTLERHGYSTSAYHGDLARASRLQSAAAVLGGVAAGGLFGALPVLARDRNTRRFLSIFTVVSGVVTTAGGVALASLSRRDLGDSLRGIADPNSDWRVSRADFWASQSPSLTASAMIGVGSGLVLGAAVAALTERRLSQKPGARRARLQLVPTPGGLLLHARF